MFYNEIEVEAIKLAGYNGGKYHISPQKLLLKSIFWLNDMYELEKNKIYLNNAIWSIYAYLELGFPYEEGEAIFKKVLYHLEIDKAAIFPKEKRK